MAKYTLVIWFFEFLFLFSIPLFDLFFIFMLSIHFFPLHLYDCRDYGVECREVWAWAYTVSTSPTSILARDGGSPR